MKFYPPYLKVVASILVFTFSISDVVSYGSLAPISAQLPFVKKSSTIRPEPAAVSLKETLDAYRSAAEAGLPFNKIGGAYGNRTSYSALRTAQDLNKHDVRNTMYEVRKLNRSELRMLDDNQTETAEPFPYERFKTDLLAIRSQFLRVILFWLSDDNFFAHQLTAAAVLGLRRFFVRSLLNIASVPIPQDLNRARLIYESPIPEDTEPDLQAGSLFQTVHSTLAEEFNAKMPPRSLLDSDSLAEWARARVPKFVFTKSIATGAGLVVLAAAVIYLEFKFAALPFYLLKYLLPVFAFGFIGFLAMLKTLFNRFLTENHDEMRDLENDAALFIMQDLIREKDGDQEADEKKITAFISYFNEIAESHGLWVENPNMTEFNDFIHRLIAFIRMKESDRSDVFHYFSFRHDMNLSSVSDERLMDWINNLFTKALSIKKSGEDYQFDIQSFPSIFGTLGVPRDATWTHRIVVLQGERSELRTKKSFSAGGGAYSLDTAQGRLPQRAQNIAGSTIALLFQPFDSLSLGFLAGNIITAARNISTILAKHEIRTLQVYWWKNPLASAIGTMSFHVSNKVRAIASRLSWVRKFFIGSYLLIRRKLSTFLLKIKYYFIIKELLGVNKLIRLTPTGTEDRQALGINGGINSRPILRSELRAFFDSPSNVIVVMILASLTIGLVVSVVSWLKTNDEDHFSKANIVPVTFIVFGISFCSLISIALFIHGVRGVRAERARNDVHQNSLFEPAVQSSLTDIPHPDRSELRNIDTTLPAHVAIGSAWTQIHQDPIVDAMVDHNPDGYGVVHLRVSGRSHTLDPQEFILSGKHEIEVRIHAVNGTNRNGTLIGSIRHGDGHKVMPAVYFIPQSERESALAVAKSFHGRHRLRTARHRIHRSELRKSVVTTSNLPPRQELEQLYAIRRKLERERAQTGSGNLTRIAVISDQHGTIDRFDALIVDAINQVRPGKLPGDFKLNPDEPLEDQLSFYGITFDDLRSLIYFHNLGDLMDRGPYGVKVFRRSAELIDAGLSDFIPGNHDFWMFMNLQGSHLPWYDGYNFYGYTDRYDETQGSVADLVKRYHGELADTRTKAWWAEKLAEFTAFHEKKQKETWDQLEVKVNGDWTDGARKKRVPGTGLYAQVSASFNGDKKKADLWNKFRGWYLVDIYTGVRAVGTVSIEWWEELLKGFNEAYREIERADGFDAELPANKAWREAIRMMQEDIIPVLRKDLEDHLGQGEWWWRVFEAINRQNYTSPEWWAKDWVFHKDWGTAVLKELNEANPPEKITPANYLNNPTLDQVADFFKKNFQLYLRDIYGNTYMHGFLPVDMETGEFYFTYKGVEYRGKGSKTRPSVWQGLDIISRDVRHNASLKDLYQALQLVNSWYADNTTKIKPPDVAAAINKFGADMLAEQNGFSRLFTGHLPFHEFAKIPAEKRGRVDGFQLGSKIIFTDHGMGIRFGNRGAWVLVGIRDGIQLRGFEHSGSSVVKANARTVSVEQSTDGSVERALFDNPGVPASELITQVLLDINTRIRELEQQLDKHDVVAAFRKHIQSLEPTELRNLLASLEESLRDLTNRFLTDFMMSFTTEFGLSVIETLGLEIIQKVEIILFIKQVLEKKRSELRVTTSVANAARVRPALPHSHIKFLLQDYPELLKRYLAAVKHFQRASNRVIALESGKRSPRPKDLAQARRKSAKALMALDGIGYEIQQTLWPTPDIPVEAQVFTLPGTQPPLPRRRTPKSELRVSGPQSALSLSTVDRGLSTEKPRSELRSQTVSEQFKVAVQVTGGRIVESEIIQIIETAVRGRLEEGLFDQRAKDVSGFPRESMFHGRGMELVKRQDSEPNQAIFDFTISSPNQTTVTRGIVTVTRRAELRAASTVPINRTENDGRTGGVSALRRQVLNEIATAVQKINDQANEPEILGALSEIMKVAASLSGRFDTAAGTRNRTKSKIANKVIGQFEKVRFSSMYVESLHELHKILHGYLTGSLVAGLSSGSRDKRWLLLNVLLYGLTYSDDTKRSIIENKTLRLKIPEILSEGKLDKDEIQLVNEIRSYLPQEADSVPQVKSELRATVSTSLNGRTVTINGVSHAVRSAAHAVRLLRSKGVRIVHESPKGTVWYVDKDGARQEFTVLRAELRSGTHVSGIPQPDLDSIDLNEFPIEVLMVRPAVLNMLRNKNISTLAGLIEVNEWEFAAGEGTRNALKFAVHSLGLKLKSDDPDSIARLSLSNRLKRILITSGLTRRSQISQKSDGYLMSLGGIKAASLKQIRHALSQAPLYPELDKLQPNIQLLRERLAALRQTSDAVHTGADELVVPAPRAELRRIRKSPLVDRASSAIHDSRITNDTINRTELRRQPLQAENPKREAIRRRQQDEYSDLNSLDALMREHQFKIQDQIDALRNITPQVVTPGLLSALAKRGEFVGTSKVQGANQDVVVLNTIMPQATGASLDISRELIAGQGSKPTVIFVSNITEERAIRAANPKLPSNVHIIDINDVEELLAVIAEYKITQLNAVGFFGADYISAIRLAKKIQTPLQFQGVRNIQELAGKLGIALDLIKTRIAAAVAQAVAA